MLSLAKLLFHNAALCPPTARQMFSGHVLARRLSHGLWNSDAGGAWVGQDLRAKPKLAFERRRKEEASKFKKFLAKKPAAVFKGLRANNVHRAPFNWVRSKGLKRAGVHRRPLKKSWVDRCDGLRRLLKNPSQLLASSLMMCCFVFVGPFTPCYEIIRWTQHKRWKPRQLASLLPGRCKLLRIILDELLACAGGFASCLVLWIPRTRCINTLWVHCHHGAKRLWSLNWFWLLICFATYVVYIWSHVTRRFKHFRSSGRKSSCQQKRQTYAMTKRFRCAPTA